MGAGILVMLWSLFAVADDRPISEIVVTSQRHATSRLMHAGNIDRLDTATITQVRHQHINELLTRVAGTWVVRGSGQEHQTAIRSPVLSGGGSCGGYLLLEDGIPIRPAGFCNINQLMEVNAEQAGSVEVIRGPGNAMYGSNSLHGIINVLMPLPGKSVNSQISVEAGANNYFRARASLPAGKESDWLAAIIYADDGGFREDSDYHQGNFHSKRSGSLWDGRFSAGFSATNLSQDTAGFIFGQDAYRDEVLSRSNPNPPAFREARSERLYGIWTGSFDNFDLDLRPYLRHTDTQFRHHALPGRPYEDNGHISAGMITAATFTKPNLRTETGIDIEWADVFFRQTQTGPAEGSRVQRETRPVGKHYDYDVSSISIAAFVQSELQVSERLSLSSGLRLEYLHYDYGNNMLTGNTRDDGSECGFGGCLYTRPANRSDSFANVAPNFSASLRLSPGAQIYASLGRGFRVPQTTELYRLQNGQQVSDLESERIDSLEFGFRHINHSWAGDVSVYAMKKRDSVFRDASGFNVSGARSKHRGIESSLDWRITEALTFSLDVSYARHTYDFSFKPQRGESFTRGKDMDTAPRWLGSAEILFDPNRRVGFGLQWTSLDDYFLDSENQYSYPGHRLLNMRAHFNVSPRLRLGLRLNNLADRRYADRADFAGGRYRYLPGRGRELFAEIRYSPSQSK
jgi:outer membrane receptor protein involved in Fe transport